jgi:hypothetical protein
MLKKLPSKDGKHKSIYGDFTKLIIYLQEEYKLITGK